MDSGSVDDGESATEWLEVVASGELEFLETASMDREC